MLIPVVLKDGTYEQVFAGDLNKLLGEDRVIVFKRDNGWVMVGSDLMRGRGGYYFGPDRRHHQHVSVRHFMH